MTTITPTLPPPDPSQPFRASDHASDPFPHLLLCCTGSVATIKLPDILTALSRHRLSIRIILTPSACNFFPETATGLPTLPQLSRYPNVAALYTDASEWTPRWTRNAPILHIELRRWADLCVIAPLSADTLSKIVSGRSEGLVCSVLRAWDTTGGVDGRLEEGSQKPAQPKLTKKPVIVAPAMNTAMWNHPVTAPQIKVLEEDWGVRNGGWFEVLRPVEKVLACGDSGAGAMREWKDIVGVVETVLGLADDANGAREGREEDGG
ncbi:flavo protein [Saccharata proteae CBS 121410]|uniref:Flavo protein n=1 Tax=Saccharata proteae CBS 121410 TaxID=1314787 RepID=A0A9P4HQJ5_9PEZI|nr:flavo protein [Saccharata proteae CBS 121410]